MYELKRACPSPSREANDTGEFGENGTRGYGQEALTENSRHRAFPEPDSQSKSIV